MFETYIPLKAIILIIIFLLNLFTFVLYRLDKQRAKNHRARISERNLLFSAFLLGGIGAYLGMKVFRHKTHHRLFTRLLPVAAILTLSVTFYIILK